MFVGSKATGLGLNLFTASYFILFYFISCIILALSRYPFDGPRSHHEGGTSGSHLHYCQTTNR